MPSFEGNLLTQRHEICSLTKEFLFHFDSSKVNFVGPSEDDISASIGGAAPFPQIFGTCL